MTCFDVLHNANHILEFLSHKVDVLEQSLRLFTDRLSEMSDLAAVTTPPCECFLSLHVTPDFVLVTMSQCYIIV